MEPRPGNSWSHDEPKNYKIRIIDLKGTRIMEPADMEDDIRWYSLPRPAGCYLRRTRDSVLVTCTTTTVLPC